jgi:fructose transport system substrate-binding protein
MVAALPACGAAGYEQQNLNKDPRGETTVKSRIRTASARRRVKFGLLAVTALAGLSFGAIAAPPAKADSGKILIGLVTKTDTNPYFVKLRQSAAAEAKKDGATLIARAGKFDGDNEGQVNAIEDLISLHVKGILVTPSNSTGILKAIGEARKQGILVIALDTATDPADAVDATLATDNFQAGVKQGAYAHALFDQKFGKGTPVHLAMLDDEPGATVDTERHNGYLKGFGIPQDSPDIVGKTITHGALDQGQTGMENLLVAHPDINVVYSINEPAAEGAYAAIKDAGKTKQIILTAIDGGCLGVKYVAEGKVAATVMQFPKKMAAEGVDDVVKYVKTGQKPSGFINTGSMLITDHPFPNLPSKNTQWGAKECWG